MNLKRSALIILLLAGFITPALAQKDTVSLKTIIDKTSKFISAYPIEKVYLHLDKPYYAAGDTIWLKAYVTIDKHQPSGLSNIVYIDITNSQDSVSAFIKLPVVNGIASGSIPLPSVDFKQGNYHLRAYTAWMRNSDPDYFFNKNLIIANPIDNPVNTNISFNTVAATGSLKINAGITYQEPGELALANKKVNWVVNVNGDEIAKGKGTTDANGVLNVSLSGTPAALQNATLITVIDLGNRKESTKTFSLKKAAINRDVQFFPEGGELTVGIRSKIAFKAVNNNGLGIDIKGTITDNAGTVVANLESLHLGMGMFALMPEAGKVYKANITFADGTNTVYDLPRIKGAGINLAAYNNDAANLTVKISANDAYMQSNTGKALYVVAQSGGAIYFAAQTILDKAVYSANIPKSKFPTGIMQLTLFTERGFPVSERLVFIQHNDMLNVTLNTAAKSYTTRQKVKLSIIAKNQALPVEGNFSVSVVDESKVGSDENAETTILSNLLLTSELKGYIEKPNYYFTHKDDATADKLDVLMLTQGYRRISYRNILTDKFPPIAFFPEQNGLEISGMLRNNTGVPIAKGTLRLQIPAKNFYAETVTDMVGNYKFSKLAFPDSSQVIVNARGNTNSKNLVVTANGENYQVQTKSIYVLDGIANIDSTFKPYLANSKKRFENLRQLKEVVIKSTVYKKTSHTSYPGMSGLPGQADQDIPAARLKGCPNLLNCLPTIVLGTTVDNFQIYLMKSYNSNNKVPMQVFVNGKPVDLNYLNSISGDDVESIEVYKTDGLSRINETYGTNGIISIALKKVVKTKMTLADLQAMIPQTNLLTFTPQGYGIAREFYSPKYDPLKPVPFGGDLRSTVYWNPRVITDKTGAASVEYFNADGRGTYRATIEGIDSDGNLGRYVYRYTVK